MRMLVYEQNTFFFAFFAALREKNFTQSREEREGRKRKSNNFTNPVQFRHHHQKYLNNI